MHPMERRKTGCADRSAKTPGGGMIFTEEGRSLTISSQSRIYSGMEDVAWGRQLLKELSIEYSRSLSMDSEGAMHLYKTPNTTTGADKLNTGSTIFDTEPVDSEIDT